MLLLWALAALIAVCCYYLINSMTHWMRQGIPQPKVLLCFKDALSIIFQKKSINEIIQHTYNLFPNERYYGGYFVSERNLYIKDSMILKKIYVQDFEHFIDHKAFLPKGIDEYWDRNVIALEGQEWRDMRMILSPAFTSNKMKKMFNLVEQSANRYIEYFSKKTIKFEIEVKDVASRYTNDVIATSAFGLEVDSIAEPNNEFYKLGKEFISSFTLLEGMKFFLATTFPALNSILKVQAMKEPARSYFTQIIKEALELREKRSVTRPDMLQLLYEARMRNNVTNNENKVQHKMTDLDIIAQAMVFFFAGFESVSSLIMFTIYELAINPDVQKTLRNEINKAYEECQGHITYDKLLSLKYLDMTIAETLRKWPPFPESDRVCTKDFVIEPKLPYEKSLKITRGMQIAIPVIAIHYDPKYFPNPERFEPERFSDENKVNIDPYSYMPFGLGPRICIGNRFALMEAKTFLFKLVRNYEIAPNERTVIPIRLSKKALNTLPDHEVYVTLTKICN